MHILPNISRSKSNHTMKFAQLKSNTKYVGETSPRHFSKKIKFEHIFGSTVESFTQFVFIVCPNRELSKYIERRCRPLAFISYEVFFFFKKKQDKESSETSLPTLFFA